MFSHTSVILFTIDLIDTRLLILVTPCYGTVGMHPKGMFSCLFVSLHRMYRPKCVTKYLK